MVTFLFPPLQDPKTHFITKISALLNIGKIHLAAGEAGKALKALKVAQTRAENIGENNQAQNVYNLLGEAYQNINETGLAEFYYKKAMATAASLGDGNAALPAYLKFGKMLAKNVSEKSDTTWI